MVYLHFQMMSLQINFQKKINEIKKSKLNVKIKKKQINFLKKRFNHEILANKRTLKNVNQLKNLKI